MLLHVHINLVFSKCFYYLEIIFEKNFSDNNTKYIAHIKLNKILEQKF